MNAATLNPAVFFFEGQCYCTNNTCKKQPHAVSANGAENKAFIGLQAKGAFPSGTPHVVRLLAAFDEMEKRGHRNFCLKTATFQAYIRSVAPASVVAREVAPVVAREVAREAAEEERSHCPIEELEDVVGQNVGLRYEIQDLRKCLEEQDEYLKEVLGDNERLQSELTHARGELDNIHSDYERVIENVQGQEGQFANVEALNAECNELSVQLASRDAEIEELKRQLALARCS